MIQGTLLVIGGNGFIGSMVARTWSQSGGRVVTLGRAGLEGGKGISDHHIEATYLTSAIIEDAIANSAPDFLLHAVGSASVEASFRDPAADFVASVGTLQAVLEATRRSSRRPRVLYPSSAAIYGQPEPIPVAEDAPSRPISPYGHHKAMAELLAQEYATCFGVPVLVFRLFSVFGPHQRRLLIYELFEQFRCAEVVTVQGSGDEIRDFLHEQDLGTALISILPHLSETFEVVNLATGRGIRVRVVAELMRGYLGSHKQIHYSGVERPGHPPRWIANTAKLRQLGPAMALGERYNFEGRLRVTLANWMEAAATARSSGAF